MTVRKTDERRFSTLRGDGESSSFTAEGLFDYINESAAALAKVVTARGEKGGRNRKLSRKMSVKTTVSNKKGHHVQFVSEVEVFPLPESEGKDAWLSRQGKWGSAPPGEGVRSKKSERRRSTGGENTTDRRAWLKSERTSNFTSFQDLLKPLFWSSSSDATDDSGSVFSGDGDNSDEELQVAIELVEDDSEDGSEDGYEEDEEDLAEPEPAPKPDRSAERRGRWRRNDSSRGKRFPAPRSALKGGKQRDSTASMSDSLSHTFASDLTRKRFEIQAPLAVKSKSSDVLLRQDVLSKKLSPSQAAAAAAAGRVLMLKNDSGHMFGAAVKRKVSLRPKPEMRPPAALRGKGTGGNKKGRKKASKQNSDIRTRDTGLHMLPHMIFIFYILPLLLIGIDDMWPYFEHMAFVMHTKSEIKYKPSREMQIPAVVRMIWPNVARNPVLKNTYRLGAYVIELRGLIAVLQVIYSWFILFRVVQDRIQVRWHVQTDTESDYTDISEHGNNYAYLFKWQQDTTPRSRGAEADEDADSDLDSLPSI